MKDLGGTSAGTAASATTTWSGISNSSNPVNTTAPTGRKEENPLANVITTSTGSTTVDMNLLKWQASGAQGGGGGGQQPLAPPRAPQAVGRDQSKRTCSVDSPGHDEERLTVVEGDDSSQDSSSTNNAAAVAAAAAAAAASTSSS